MRAAGREGILLFSRQWLSEVRGLLHAGLDKFLHCQRDIGGALVVKIGGALGQAGIDFVVDHLRHRSGAGDQRVAHQRQAHVAADDVVGGGELVHLQLDVRHKPGLFAEPCRRAMKLLSRNRSIETAGASACRCRPCRMS